MKLIKKGVFFVTILIVLISSVNAISKLSLEADIPSRYKEIFAGESLIVEMDIILIDHDADEVVDVLIEYSVEDIKGHVVYRLSETKGGILRISDVKEINLPSDIKPGLYIVEIKASCKSNIISQTSETFEVIKKSYYSYFIKHKGIFIILIIFFFVFLWIYFELRKMKKYIHYRISEKTLFEKGLIKIKGGKK